MPRTLLINREDGRDLKPYGVKKVETNMKFSFIISVVIVFVWCGIATAESRIINDLKYLEYLNDLDRRNVELDDIHKQWPFHSIVRNIDDEEPVEGVPEPKPFMDGPLLQSVNIATDRLANKHGLTFGEPVGGQFDDNFKEGKEIWDRTDPLSQYRRHKPLNQEILEEARMYPERNDEEPVFNLDDNGYQNSDLSFDDEDEELTELRPSLPRPLFARIAAVEKPVNYEHAFQDSEEEESEEQEEEIPKPSFPKAYFPRIAHVDIPVNYKIEGLEFGVPKSFLDEHNSHHVHEDYKFKEEEEFPQSIAFNEVPVVEDPGEFGVGPADPRFYRDLEPTEDKVTAVPKQEDSVHPYLVKSPYVSKPKMNSRSDQQKQQQNLPSDELQLESFVNKDVEVVPFKPDTQADTAGVYIIAIVAGISAAATVGLIAVGIGWYKYMNGRLRNTVDGCISE